MLIRVVVADCVSVNDVVRVVVRRGEVVVSLSVSPSSVCGM